MKRRLWPVAVVLGAAVIRLWIGLGASRRPLSWDLGDVAQWMDAGDRMIAGERPYRDFIAVYGPLLYDWTTAWYRACGTNWHAALLQLELISPLACLALIFWIAKRSLIEPVFQALFIAACFTMGLDRFFWSPALRAWLPLAGLMLAATSNKEREIFVGGLLCGLSVLISAETGAAALAGWLAFAAIRRKNMLTSISPLIPLLLFAAARPVETRRYAEAMSRYARLTNWYVGLPLQVPWAWSSVPVISAFLLFTAAVVLRFREDWPLIVYAALGARTFFGRSDYSHLLFITPPIVLLWMRFCASLKSKNKRTFALCALLPWAHAAALRPTGIAPQIQRPSAAALADWPEEGIRGPAPFLNRMRTIASLVRAATPEGERVLSLPMPLYAHLSGRLSALVANHPDHLLMAPDGPERQLAALASAPTAIIDSTLLLPLPRDFWAQTCDDPLDGRLTWFSPADEAITRELRAELKRRYELKWESGGASLFFRRKQSQKQPRETLVWELKEPRALSNSFQTIDIGSVRANEVRLNLRSRPIPILESLSKTYVRMVVNFKGRAPLKGFLPLAPNSLNRDLRFPVPREPITSIELAIANPGALNLSPGSASLTTMSLIAR